MAGPPSRSDGDTPPSGSVRGSTSIDLGDDLIEQTAMLPGEQESRPGGTELDAPPSPPLVSSLNDAEDQLESAKILLNEGLVEDAKRILRRIILSDPGHVAARKKLEEIHQLELKQIFGDGSMGPTNPMARRGFRKSDPQPAYRATETVMRDLDRDLRLGIFAEEEWGGDAGGAMSALFPDEKSAAELGASLDSSLASCSARDRIDIGVAFLEMGLPDLASRQFKAALRDPEQELVASSLLAHSLIRAGRPFEATLTVEQVLANAELKSDQRIGFIYLMGRACEQLGKPDLAKQWYERVRQAEPGFRDVEERIRVLIALQASLTAQASSTRKQPG